MIAGSGRQQQQTQIYNGPKQWHLAFTGMVKRPRYVHCSVSQVIPVQLGSGGSRDGFITYAWQLILLTRGPQISEQWYLQILEHTVKIKELSQHFQEE